MKRNTAAAREAARLAPESGPALLTLCEALRLRGKMAEARGVAERYLQVDPASPYPHESLARIAVARGSWAEAEGHLRAGLRLDGRRAAVSPEPERARRRR